MNILNWFNKFIKSFKIIKNNNYSINSSAIQQNLCEREWWNRNFEKIKYINLNILNNDLLLNFKKFNINKKE